MKTLLIYGDSNTHGSSPTMPDGSSYRYGPEIRWPARLAKSLGSEWHVIDEGLPGRTTAHDNPFTGAHKNGLSLLPAFLESHAPIDVFAVMLGTNDLKARLNLPAVEIGEGLRQILLRVQAGTYGRNAAQPKLLVIAPAPIKAVPPYSEALEGGVEKSRRLAEIFANVAQAMGAAFFDAGRVANVSEIDGVHLTEDAHISLAQALHPIISAM